jgi:PST family polysaccharide transporter
MTLRAKVARGLAWSAMRIWGTQLSSLLVFVVLSRLLDPTAFGLVALAMVFTRLIQIFLDRGFSDALIQRVELDEGHLDTAFWIGIFFSGLLAVGGVLASDLVAALLREPEIAPIIRWLSLVFLFSGLNNVQKAILRREMAFRSLAIRSIVATIVGGVAGVTMALRGYGVWSLVGLELVTGLAGVIVLWQVSDWRPGRNVSKRHFDELFGFSLGVLGTKVVEFLNRRADHLLIGMFLGTTALGYYSVGLRIVLVIQRLLVGISTSVAFPAFSKLQSDPARMRRGFYSATQYTSVIALPAFLGVAAIAPELVVLVFGPQWEPSVPVMQALSLVGVIQSILLFNNSVIKSAGKPAWVFGIMLGTAILNLVGFAMVVHNGILAVALVYVFVSYLLSPLSVIAVRRLLRIDLGVYLWQFFPSVISSGVMLASLMVLNHVLPQGMPPLARVSLYVVAGAAVYIVMILVSARSIPGQLRAFALLALPGFKVAKARAREPVAVGEGGDNNANIRRSPPPE